MRCPAQGDQLENLEASFKDVETLFQKAIPREMEFMGGDDPKTTIEIQKVSDSAPHPSFNHHPSSGWIPGSGICCRRKWFCPPWRCRTNIHHDIPTSTHEKAHENDNAPEKVLDDLHVHQVKKQLKNGMKIMESRNPMMMPLICSSWKALKTP